MIGTTAGPRGANSDFFALSGRFVPGLDGLRGLACLMIFNVHYFAQFAPRDYFTEPGSPLHAILRVLHSGSHGVDIFFVISGYLIYGSIRRKRPGLLSFLLERYKRLLPVILVVNVPALYWIDANWREVVDNVFFLRLFPDSRMVTFVTWALVYEMYFYLLCGAWLIAGRRGRDRAPWASFGLLAALFVANSLFFKVNPVLSDWRFVGFFIGLGLAMIEEGPRGKALLARVRPGVWPVCLGLILVACLLWSRDALAVPTSISPALGLAYFTLFDLVAALLMASFPRGRQDGFTPFAWRGPRVFGAVSYSLFLMHTQWGLPLAARLFPLAPSGPAGLLAHYLWSLGLTFILAVFLFAHLERFYFARR